MPSGDGSPRPFRLFPVDALNRVGAHPAQKVPFVPDRKRMGDADLPLWPFRERGPSEQGDQGCRADRSRNETVAGRHPLQRGTVWRLVVLRDGGYRIFTVGAGDGPFGFFNVLLARSGFWNQGWYEVGQKVRVLLAR